jgi:hypothetical protein
VGCTGCCQPLYAVPCCAVGAQEFQTMMSGLMQNPSMMGATLNDPRMQLVSGCSTLSTHNQSPLDGSSPPMLSGG